MYYVPGFCQGIQNDPAVHFDNVKSASVTDG